MKKKEAVLLDNVNVMLVPLVNQYAYAGYLDRSMILSSKLAKKLDILGVNIFKTNKSKFYVIY